MKHFRMLPNALFIAVSALVLGAGTANAQPPPVGEVNVVVHVDALRVLSAPGGALDDPNPDPYVYAQCKEIGLNRDFHADDGQTPHEDDVKPVALAATLPSQSITLNCPEYAAAGGGTYVRLMVAVIDKDGSGGIYRDQWMLRSTQFDYPCPGPTSWILRAGTGGHADLDYTVSCHTKPQPVTSIGTGAFGTRDLPRSVASDSVFSVTLSIDVNETLAPSSLSVTELIPEGFRLMASMPPPTRLEQQVIDGVSILVAARWDFSASQVRDQAIELQIAAPSYGTPDCGVEDPEQIAMNATVAAHLVGLVAADGRRFVTHGPHCLQVIGPPGQVKTPDPLPPAVDPSLHFVLHFPIVRK